MVGSMNQEGFLALQSGEDVKSRYLGYTKMRETLPNVKNRCGLVQAMSQFLHPKFPCEFLKIHNFGIVLFTLFNLLHEVFIREDLNCPHH